jgi:hypothetical protein
MERIKTYNATGVAPDGRLYAGDLNLLQDSVAGASDFTQTVDLATLRMGETGLQLFRYGAGEARLTGALRTDGILRGLGGIISGAFTTAQRDAIATGLAPYGTIILNTTTNRYEWNSGTDVARSWQPFSVPLVPKTIAQWPPANPQQGQVEVLADTFDTVVGAWVLEYRPDLDSLYSWSLLNGGYIAKRAPGNVAAGNWSGDYGANYSLGTTELSVAPGIRGVWRVVGRFAMMHHHGFANNCIHMGLSENGSLTPVYNSTGVNVQPTDDQIATREIADVDFTLDPATDRVSMLAGNNSTVATAKAGSHAILFKPVKLIA